MTSIFQRRLRPGFRQLGLMALTLGLMSCTHAPVNVPVATPPAPPAVSPQPAPPIAREPNPVTDPRAIATAQRILDSLGYPAGKPDGIFGPATRRAILAFQKDRRLTEDGILTTAIVEKLSALQNDAPKESALKFGRGDILIYSDGSIVTVAADRAVPLQQASGDPFLVAARPSTAGWPTEARVGLDWAITHALEDPASDQPISWSSTGVPQHFEIRAYPPISLKDAKLDSDTAPSCRRFELRADQAQRRYPGIACVDAKGVWYIPHSHVALASPATELSNKSEPARRPK